MHSCTDMRTDGAGVMAGRRNGLAARIRQKVVNVRWMHYSIHRESVAVKKIPSEMKAVWT
jgi:hypothetical protein